jgi:hypothetical protein
LDDRVCVDPVPKPTGWVDESHQGLDVTFRLFNKAIHRWDAGVLGTMNLLEPPQLVQEFLDHPPQGFQARVACNAIPGFVTRFDLLTTAEPQIKRFVAKLPFFSFWKRLLQPQAYFVGTTVSEYVVLPSHADPELVADCLLHCQGRLYPFVIVKDLPRASPLLSTEHNEFAQHLASALQRRGFVLMDGQALAYVPIDFPDIDTYLARLSYGRRKDIRRKLRVRDQLRIGVIPTGDAAFSDPAMIDRIYAMYLNVYDQSEIHFDLLSRDFFAALLRDTSNCGVVFLYHQGEELIGYNLCFTTANALVDKYIGFVYPQAREMNLYFVSWIHNLNYALQHGLSMYIAGWTDPKIKAYLGARFTMTQHAVYVRSRFVRAILRRVAGRFETDHDFAETTHATNRS